MPKFILRSRSFWTNLIGLAVALASPHIPGLGEYMTPERQAELALGILAVVNILLRVDTKDPVYIRKPKGGEDG